MSAMAEAKSPPDLALVRQQIERLEQELAIWRATEQGLLAVKAGESSMGLKGRFKNLKPWQAIEEFLKMQGSPQPRSVIIRAVIEGEAKLGVDKEKSINQSITANGQSIKKPKFKEPAFDPAVKEQSPSNLVGLASWPNDKFKV